MFHEEFRVFFLKEMKYFLNNAQGSVQIPNKKINYQHKIQLLLLIAYFVDLNFEIRHDAHLAWYWIPNNWKHWVRMFVDADWWAGLVGAHNIELL